LASRRSIFAPSNRRSASFHEQEHASSSFPKEAQAARKRPSLPLYLTGSVVVVVIVVSDELLHHAAIRSCQTEKTPASGSPSRSMSSSSLVFRICFQVKTFEHR